MTDDILPSRPSESLSVAFLTNLIPPYHKPVLDVLSKRYRRMRVLISTPMEKNRPWKPDWQGLDVVVQKTLTFKGKWRHPRGFGETLAVHIPLDTFQQLRKFSPDVVISAEMGARTLFAILFRKLHPRSRLIIWAEAAESTESGRGLARQIVRRILVRNADAFLAIGGRAVQYLSHIGADPSKIFKIAYTTEVARFSANGFYRPPETARRLLYSGQFVERKGLIPFLGVLSDWAAANPQRHIEFWLVGDGPLRLEPPGIPPAAKR